MSTTVTQQPTKTTARQRPVVTIQQETPPQEHAATPSNGPATTEATSDSLPSLTDLVSDLSSHLDMFLETIRKYWDVKMSKDTVFLFGGMEGHYREMISSVERDISQP